MARRSLRRCGLTRASSGLVPVGFASDLLLTLVPVKRHRQEDQCMAVRVHQWGTSNHAWKMCLSVCRDHPGCWDTRLAPLLIAAGCPE